MLYNFETAHQGRYKSIFPVIFDEYFSVSNFRQNVWKNDGSFSLREKRLSRVFPIMYVSLIRDISRKRQNGRMLSKGKAFSFHLLFSFMYVLDNNTTLHTTLHFWFTIVRRKNASLCWKCAEKYMKRRKWKKLCTLTTGLLKRESKPISLCKCFPVPQTDRRVHSRTLLILCNTRTHTHTHLYIYLC